VKDKRRYGMSLALQVQVLNTAEMRGGREENMKLSRRGVKLGSTLNKRARNTGTTQDRILTESAADSQTYVLKTLLNTLKLQQNDLDSVLF
jgi:hypothetical protein